MYTIVEKIGCNQGFFDEAREEKKNSEMHIDGLLCGSFYLGQELLAFADGADEELWKESLKECKI